MVSVTKKSLSGRRSRHKHSLMLKFSLPTIIIGHILLTLLVILIFLPIAFTILYSILPSGVIPNISALVDIVDYFSPRGYIDVFRQLPFIRIIGNSVYVTLISTVLQLTVAFMTAYALTHWDFPGRDFIFGIIIIAMIIPSVSLIVPNYMTASRLGMIKEFSGVIIPGIANGYGIFLMRQFFGKVPKSLVDACRIDGGNELRILWHVYLPISLPAVMALFIILLVANWNDYQWPLLILQNPDKLTLPLAIVRFHNEGMIDWMPTAAACIMTMIPIMILYIFMQKQIVDTYASSATKE